MKIKNEMIVLCLMFFILISITAVSAENNNTDIIATNDNAEDNVLSVNEENILNEPDSGSFADLNTKINTGTSTEIILENDYNYTAAYESGNGVTITRSNIVIDGKGHTIDGNGQSRAFAISVEGVTLKNIKFMNAKSPYGGGAIYVDKPITFINCTFIGNTANGPISNGGGGAIFANSVRNAKVNIYDCTFINNTVTASHGGALYFRGIDLKIENSTFENNNANGYSGGAVFIYGVSNGFSIVNSNFTNNKASLGGAIKVESGHSSSNPSYLSKNIYLNNSITGDGGSAVHIDSYSTINIDNSIFLSKNVQLYSPSYSSTNADYNWWGNTIENSTIEPSVSNTNINNWYFLDMDDDFIQGTADISLNNLYANGEAEIYQSNLPALTFVLSAVNATVPTDITLKNGVASFEYNRVQSKGLLKANYENIEISKEFGYGDFELLQKLVDESTTNNIELQCDYNYIIGLDTITDGILINKSNIVIDGKGKTIDAKGQSRIFNIKSDNVTLMNINFINAYAAYAGAIYYMGDHIDIINCNFINNTVQQQNDNQGLGGAIYMRPTVYGNVTGCIFINNTASKAGNVISTYGNAYYNISNSIFLNNTHNGISIISSSSTSFYADYNWWGNTGEDYNISPFNIVKKYYYLDIEFDFSNKQATISLNNLYDVSTGTTVRDNENCKLPSITLDLVGTNCTVPNKVILNNLAKNTVNFNVLKDDGALTASLEDVNFTKSFHKESGDFDKLDALISGSAGNLIELDRNYTYTIGVDEITDGIEINRNNLIIDGKGYTVDAKGQSRIFYVYGDGITLKNMRIINGKSGYGGAIYEYGDGLTIINCTFINNTATGYYGAGAAYLCPDSYCAVVNSTFINNTADRVGGALVLVPYYNSARADVINSTFIGNNATIDPSYGGGYGGAIFTNGESNSCENIVGCTFIGNDAVTGSAVYNSKQEVVKLVSSIFLNNTGVVLAAVSTNFQADYNWFGHVYDNRTISPNVTSKVNLDKWLYLDIILNIADSTATISINNLFDNETKTTTTYSTTALPTVNVKLSAENATLSKDNLTLDNEGKCLVGYVITTDASITASCGEISQTRNIDYGSFDKLQTLIRNAGNDTTITLNRDYIWGMGDTITQGIVVDDKHNLIIDGNGHVIDGSGKSRGFIVSISSRNVVLKNMIIQNCRYGGNNINYDYGGAIVWDAPNAQLINCTFINNSASGTTGGGALYVSNDNANIVDCKFINNTHGFSVAGAIYLHGSGANIINCLFENNIASDTLQGGAGAIYLASGGTNIKDCTFNNNIARYGGAIVDENYGEQKNIIDNCTFIGNVATYSANDLIGGGAIYSLNLTVKNSDFIDNQAKYGGAILSQYDGTNIDKSIFINNTATDGIISLIYGGKISNSIFLNNHISNSYVVSSIFGGVIVEDNWFGNTWKNYNTNYYVTNLANQTSWLFLNVTEMSYDFDNKLLTVKFGILSYNPNSSEIIAYDFNKLPQFNLTLTTQNVTFDKNTVGIDEEISGSSEYKGSIVAEYESVKYTIPFKYQKESWIEADSILNLTVGDYVTYYGNIRPWEDYYQPFIREPGVSGNVIYSTSDSSVVTVSNNGRITAVSEGLANITIIYKGKNAQGEDVCLPCNKTVLVNVTRMATHFHFTYEPPTIIYVGGDGDIMASVYDAKNKSISGASITFTNNNETVLRLAGNSYRALAEGTANITMSYAGSSEYLPFSYNLIIPVSRRTATITAAADYLELNITKHYNLGVSINPSTLSIIASSNDTNVAVSDNDGFVSAVGVGIAKLTFRFEGNDNYKPTEIYVIVNVTAAKAYIDAPDTLNLNLTDTFSIPASVRDSQGNLIGYEISFASSDIGVVSVDDIGIINTVGVGMANITLTFPGRNEYGPTVKNITVTVRQVPTEIIVNDTLDMYVGERINLDAALNYPKAGTLQYDYEGDNIVVNNRGNVAAISEGIARVTITAVMTSDKYSAPALKTVTVNVTRKSTEINLQKDIFELNVFDEENINATTVPKDVGVLKYMTNDSSVAIVDQFGNIVAKGVGTANITVYYEGNSNYLPATEYVIVKVTAVPTEIIVDKTYGLIIDNSGNLNAVLNHPEAGTLIYASENENIVTVDEYGNLTTVSVGSTNVTITFEGNENYTPTMVKVLVTVYPAEIPTEIIVNDTIEAYVGDQMNIEAELNPANAGNLTYASSNTDIVVVDDKGNIHAVKVGVANITITFPANERFNASNATVKIIVSRIPTQIHVDENDITLNLTENTTIIAGLNPPQAGNLTYTSSDDSIVSVDEKGLIIANSVGDAIITISYVGNENYTAASDVEVHVTVTTVTTEITVSSTELSLNVEDGTNINATLNYPEAGDLIYSSSNSSVVTVDELGNIYAISEGVANITVKFEAEGKYLASNKTVRVTVSKITTDIHVDETSITLNLTDSVNVHATLTPDEAGSLTYISSNSSVVTVDDNGELTAVGAGSAVITINFAETNRYRASEATVNVAVTTVPTQISVSSDEIELFVEDATNINATLNYPEAGDLIYSTSNDTVVTVDNQGNVIAIGEGVANITIEFRQNGKYLASNKTVKVTVSRIATEISVDKLEINLFVDDEVNVNATLNYPQAGTLDYTTADVVVASIDENGNLTAGHEGTTNAIIRFTGNNKYAPSEKIIKVIVSRIPTKIEVNSTKFIEIGSFYEQIQFTTNPINLENFVYESSNSSIIEVYQNGYMSPVDFGSANITVKFEGDEKYAPSNATMKVTVKGRVTKIEVNETFALTVEETRSIGADLVYSGAHWGSNDLRYESSDSSIVTIDENGIMTALKKGTAQIRIYYAGINTTSGEIINYPSNATVNITVLSKASEISLDKTKVTLQVDQNFTVRATLITPSAGELTFTSADESIATVDAIGKITAVGKGTTTITVSFAGNEEYRPSNKTIEVIVMPISTEIIVNKTITILQGDSANIGAVLNPDVGQLGYYSSNEEIVIIDDDGKITGLSASNDPAVISVFYNGNNRYAGCVESVTVYVTLNKTSIDVNPNIELNVGDITNLNATLIPDVGNLEYFSSDENIVKVYSNGSVIAVGEGKATITIKFPGDPQHEPSDATVDVTVNKNTQAVDLDLNVPEDGTSPVFSISLPADATGTFTVIVDGKEVETKTLVNGQATISVLGLSSGDHNVTLLYSGDSKYGNVSKSSSIHIYDIKMDKNTDISTLYTAGARYTVHLTRDTQAFAGQTVKFTVNGKVFNVVTNAKGYASVYINLPPRAKAYVVTAQFGNVKVQNKVTVKSIIVAKNLKIKKSKKVVKIRVSLKKVNGKYLKGKKIKLKIKGKTLKAKTNKKGKAVFKLKKKVLKKLKVGKKYRYKVFYGKDKVTKKIKVKR